MTAIKRVSGLGLGGESAYVDGSIQTADLANNVITQSKLDTAVPLSGFRNLIINGDMRIAQRGTSTSGITTANYYTTDRWYLNLSNGGAWTMAQTTDAPTNEGFGYSTKLTCTTAQASPSITNNARFWQKIEGNNLSGLAKGTSNPKPLVVSFWVKSGFTGTYVCTLDDLDNSRKISASYTINTAHIWEKKTISFAGDTVGSLILDNSDTFMVAWWLLAGPSFQGSPLSTSWSSSGTLSDYATGQTNLASGNNASVNYWQITGVQVEQGTQPTPFEQRPLGTELTLCQRYYEKSNGIHQVTAGATGFGGNTYWNWVSYKVEKRIALNLGTNFANNAVTVAATDGGSNYITMWKAATQYYSNVVNFEIYTNQGFGINTTGGQTDAGLARFYWFASAEL